MTKGSAYSITQITRAYRKTVTAVDESVVAFSKNLSCMKNYTFEEVLDHCYAFGLSPLQTSRLMLAIN